MQGFDLDCDSFVFSRSQSLIIIMLISWSEDKGERDGEAEEKNGEKEELREEEDER